jgi:hypothetical protein
MAAATTTKEKDEMLGLVSKHASLLGYYDRKIDLTKDDLSSGVYINGCTLTAHAPLWGTKAGEEKPLAISEVRKTLNNMLKFATPERHDMYMAVNGDKAICLYFMVKIKLNMMPCFYMMKVPLLFVVSFATSDDGKLMISDIHEWPTESPESGKTVLTETLGWPVEAAQFEKYENFGALS